MPEILKRSLSGAVFVALLWFSIGYSQITYLLLFSCFGILSLIEMNKLRIGKNKFFAFSYIVIPFGILLYFGATSYEMYYQLILFILLLTWTFDTFAYLLGKNFGRHKILPNISPKKSWEGFCGGFIFTIIVGMISHTHFEITSDVLFLIVCTLPFTATAGDLIESYYKRKAEVKDSGNIIPGHGGILDRMDAILITIPFLFILKLLKLL